MRGAVRRAVVSAAALAAGAAAAVWQAPAPAVGGPGPVIAAVGAENEYANVIGQIGGRYVRVTAVETNPNTDPHAFEASPSVARAVSAAQIVVQNGLGYDTYMQRIEAASPSASRRVLVVQRLLGLPDSTANPHLWYRPATMPAVANALVGALSALAPSHRAYFQANARRFEASLKPWYAALAALAKRYPKTPVATTEPVADYMLAAAGMVNRTPVSFETDVMNGVDPAPQAVSLEDALFSEHQVRVFVYNQQVTDSLTASFLAQAKRYRIPVVGVYETMPAPGFDYQSWMLAEVRALQRALAGGTSTERL